MEARAFDYSGTTLVERRQRRRFLTRFIKAKAELAPAPNVIEVGPDEEYAHFEECMNNPQGPTPALTKGAALLRSLFTKNP